MNDRELLERAAKAAGIKLVWHNFSNIPTLFKGLSSDEVWNPLEDDGDALRLAVKLRIQCEYGNQDDEPMVLSCFCSPIDGRWMYFTEREGASVDPYAATRRAIVRAAAAMEG